MAGKREWGTGGSVDSSDYRGIYLLFLMYKLLLYIHNTTLVEFHEDDDSKENYSSTTSSPKNIIR